MAEEKSYEERLREYLQTAVNNHLNENPNPELFMSI